MLHYPGQIIIKLQLLTLMALLIYQGNINAQSNPNVILVLADDLGYGDLSCYGNEDINTPYLEELAESGVRFTQNYAAAPLCAPSRAALPTGRYSHRTGAISVESNRGLDRISLREQTIGNHFQQAGYRTGMIGKWHNGIFDNAHHPNQRGFDQFFGFLNGGMFYYDWILDHNGEVVSSDGKYLTDVLTEAAIDFMKKESDKPFFLFLSYNAPHSPLEAPQGEVKKYLKTGRHNQAVSTLYAMITIMDKGIGKIMEHLEKRNIKEQTIVLFTSDNGPWLGDEKVNHDRQSCSRYNASLSGMKQDVLEGGIKVPAILSWPDHIPVGLTYNGIVNGTDWLPTLIYMAGLDVQFKLPLDGINIYPYIKNDSETTISRFWQFNRYEPVDRCNAAVREGVWKLYYPWIPEARQKLNVDNIWYRGMYHLPHFETKIDMKPYSRYVSHPVSPKLYNIKHDPGEQNDLSAQYPAKVRHLSDQLGKWFQEVNDERLSLPDTWKGFNLTE